MPNISKNYITKKNNLRVKEVLILILFILSLSVLPVNGEEKPIVEKGARITILNDNYLRVETFYIFEPEINAYLFSDAIAPPSEFRNVSIKINSVEISRNEYFEKIINTINGPYKYLVVNKPLEAHADIQKKNRVYFQYESKQNFTTFFSQLRVIEMSLITKSKTHVKYRLLVQSQNTEHIIAGFPTENVTCEYDYDYAKCSFDYDSFQYNETTGPVAANFNNIIIYNTTSNPGVQESSLTIKVLSPSLIKQTFSRKVIGSKESGFSHVEMFPIFALTQPTRPIEPIINIDGQSKTAAKVDFDELDSNPYQYFYCIKEGYLFIGYELPEGSIGDIGYDIEVDGSKVINTTDYFNYIFSDWLITPAYSRDIRLFVIFELPDEFVIDDTNYKENLVIIPKENSNQLRFRFDDSPQLRKESFQIKFSRSETKVLNYVKFANIPFSIGLFIFLFLVYYKKTSYKTVSKVLSALITTVLSIITMVFSIEMIGQAFVYTRMYIPIILTLCIVIIQKRTK